MYQVTKDKNEKFWKNQAAQKLAMHKGKVWKTFVLFTLRGSSPVGHRWRACGARAGQLQVTGYAQSAQGAVAIVAGP